MNRLPECLVVIDPRKEKNAVSEAAKLGITTVSLIDTDCDPDTVDLPIPGNDDGIRSVELIVTELANSIVEGASAAAAMAQKSADSAAAAQSAAIAEKIAVSEGDDSAAESKEAAAE